MAPYATSVPRRLSQCSIAIVGIASAQAAELLLLSRWFTNPLCVCCAASQNIIGSWVKRGAGQIAVFALTAVRHYLQRARLRLATFPSSREAWTMRPGSSQASTRGLQTRQRGCTSIPCCPSRTRHPMSFVAPGVVLMRKPAVPFAFRWTSRGKAAPAG